jgi:hypothetical protein
MSAAAVERPGPGNFQDASPREVRAALVPEEQPDFDLQWQRAMTEATATFDLTEVFEILDSWRRRAAITTALGYAGYRRMLIQAENTLRTGNPPPGAVPLAEVKAYLAERLGE